MTAPEVAGLAAMIDAYADEVVAYERASTKAENKAALADLNAAKARIIEAFTADRQRFVMDFDGAADAGIDAAVAAERERCAQVAEALACKHTGANAIAAAIRNPS